VRKRTTTGNAPCSYPTEGEAVWDQAVWIRAKCRAGDQGGARADQPRCVRILAITVGSTIAAMIVKAPPLLKDTAPSLGVLSTSRIVRFCST
jgi:hypothetical protein